MMTLHECCHGFLPSNPDTLTTFCIAPERASAYRQIEKQHSSYEMHSQQLRCCIIHHPLPTLWRVPFTKNKLLYCTQFIDRCTCVLEVKSMQMVDYLRREGNDGSGTTTNSPETPSMSLAWVKSDDGWLTCGLAHKSTNLLTST